MNGCIFADGALELENDERQSVDVENGVRDALFVALDLQLVDDFEAVVAVAIFCGRVF